MYDNTTHLLVKNPINRYLINSAMLQDLYFDGDGSLTLYIQHEEPEAKLLTNWLPAPDQIMSLVMRLYLPKIEVLQGQWQPPKIIRHEKGNHSSMNQ